MSNAPFGFDETQEPDEAFFLASEQQGPQSSTPRRALVVLISDHAIKAGADTDRLCTELLTEGEFTVDAVVHVPKSQVKIRQAIETAVVGGVDLVLTVGGTGVSARDKTPEATREVLDQDVPGVAQALRFSGLSCGAVDAATSRGISGVSGSTVVINLADSRAAIRDGMATLTPLVHHLIDQLRRAEVQ